MARKSILNNYYIFDPANRVVVIPGGIQREKLVLITNVTDESLLNSLKSAAADPAFLHYLKASKHTNISTSPTQIHVDSYLKSIDQLNVLLTAFDQRSDK